ncbi:hypothetical protein SAMN04487939_10739 [Lysobacter sp. yr284]|uniref:hypothetical protein n=1 Tax=Lysobacter TaxID=68 RepID=UPI00089A4934|nr:hypothetical protein [Lysobacter sp. yr284]SDY85613.1 hypothetical protein SAMN04487939_10739 [Lysobacter sp. yr284]
MSTIRNSSANEDAKRAQQLAQEAQLSDRQRAARQSAPAESVDQFRELMQQRQAVGQKGEQTLGAQPEDGQYAAGDAAAQALRGRQQNALERGRNQYAQDQGAQNQAAQGQARQHGVEQKSRDEQRYSVGFDRGGGDGQSSEQSGLWLAQQAMRADQAAPMQAPAPTSNAAAFAELVERHVRQLAVSGDGTDGGDGQVLLRLSDQTLPGTDLLLSKTAEGWQLRADSRSRSSYDAIREAGPELMRRFAERNLGPLSIDPHFHD